MTSPFLFRSMYSFAVQFQWQWLSNFRWQTPSAGLEDLDYLPEVIETHLDGALHQVRAGDSLPGDVLHCRVSPDGSLAVENEGVILPAYLLHPEQVLADERQ
ncbi:MAG: hypothetical protein ACI4TD_04600, partial [Phocaeicola sp.]